MQFFQDIDVDFLGARKIAFILSAVLIFAGVLSLIIKGGPNYSIDFTGGKFVQLKFSEKPNLSEIREVLSDVGLGDSQVQSVEGEKILFVRTAVKNESGEEVNVINTIRSYFEKNHPETEITLMKSEKVGPEIGKELKNKAFWAILIAVGAILIYIWFRFQFRFGVAAIIALVHDVLITLGLFSLLGREIGLPVVGAFLTIVGYSINDTIVISDRIRENLQLLVKKPFKELVNTSINQTISRTFITSLVVLMVVTSLVVFGGKVIRDFALALLIGTIVGTYSSIYVVSPIVVAWEQKSPKRFKK